MILKNCTAQEVIDVLQSLPKNQQFIVSIEIETIKNQEIQQEETLSKRNWNVFFEEIKNHISINGSIQHSLLLRKFNSKKQKYFAEAIKRLIESKTITVFISTALNGKQVTFYQLA